MRMVRHTGENIAPADDRSLYEQMFNDGMFNNVSFSIAGGNQITISPAFGIMQGSEFTSEQTTINVTLPGSSGSGVIYAQFDITQGQPFSFGSALAPYTPRYEDINGTGTVCQMIIATYNATEVNVTDVTPAYNMADVNGLRKVTDIIENTGTSVDIELKDGYGQVLNYIELHNDFTNINKAPLHIGEGTNPHTVIGTTGAASATNKFSYLEERTDTELVESGIRIGKNTTDGAYLSILGNNLYIGDGSLTNSGDAKIFMKSSTNNRKEVMRGYGGDSNGIGVMIGAGGSTVIGSGESANNLIANDVRSMQSGTTEAMMVASDTNIFLETNANTVANAYEFSFNSTGNSWFPGDIKFFVDSRNASNKYANKFLMTEILSNFIISREFSLDNQIVPASSFKDFSIPFTSPSGYKVLLGVHGVLVNEATSSGANSTQCAIINFWSNESSAVVRLRNIYTAAAKVKIIVKMLFIRDI